MKRLIIIFAFIGVFGNVFANQTLLDSAAVYFEQEQYDDAIRIWQNQIDENGMTSEAFYNLGNAYYKKNEIALSILNYERALMLDPTDEDISHNLNIANLMIKDHVEAIPDLFFVVWLNALNTWISGNTWAVLSGLFFVICILLVGVVLFRKTVARQKLSVYLAIFFLFVSVVSLALAFRSNKMMHNSNKAIVMHDVMVKSSPSETGKNLFEVHKGLKVEIDDAVSDFTEIRLSDGNKGWVKTENIDRISM